MNFKLVEGLTKGKAGEIYHWLIVSLVSQALRSFFTRGSEGHCGRLQVFRSGTALMEGSRDAAKTGGSLLDLVATSPALWRSNTWRAWLVCSSITTLGIKV